MLCSCSGLPDTLGLHALNEARGQTAEGANARQTSVAGKTLTYDEQMKGMEPHEQR
jgi:hypothetical protein